MRLNIFRRCVYDSNEIDFKNAFNADFLPEFQKNTWET